MGIGKFTLAELKVRKHMTTSEFEDLFENNKVPDYKIRKELLTPGSGNFTTDEKDFIATVLGTVRSRIDWRD
ncbi:hypothetical protein K9L27_02150 [Candidatus Gracilibacteria bacterium]|nr:hypothetical protein [Candidatus Gracilibacteria bacterium]